MKIWIILCLGLEISQSALAHPLLRKLKNELIAQVSNRPSSPEVNCVNFSGVWAGSCNVNGQVQPQRIQIHQTNCSLLQYEDEDFFISGINNNQSSGFLVDTGKRLAIGATYMMNWNPNRTALEYVESLLIQGENAQTAAVSARETLQLINGSLVTDLVYGSGRVQCSYRKSS